MIHTPSQLIISFHLLLFLYYLPNISLCFHQSKLRYIEQNQFLADSITKAENNIHLQHYLSTKHLYWNTNAKGQKVNVAIFDSGINTQASSSKCNIVKQYDYTNSLQQMSDEEGHGTYIASLICSEDKGIAPQANVFSYKVFNNQGLTESEWIIQAMKQAIKEDKVDIINFSFGGINFNDTELISLITEAVDNNIIIISSAGNDGPSKGTIVFPGSLPNVITVGAASADVLSIYRHSSRGPAMNDNSMLIPKPNTWAPGEEVVGYSLQGRKSVKNGSSIATAIVTGFVALLLSRYYDDREMFNNAVLMGMISDCNINIVGRSRYEEISGLFNPQGMMELGGIVRERRYNGSMRVLNYVQDFTNVTSVAYDYGKEYDGNGKGFDGSQVIYASIQPIKMSLIVLNMIHRDKDIANEEDEGLSFAMKILPHPKQSSTSKIESCIELSLLTISSSSSLSKVFIMNLELSSSSPNQKCQHYHERINWKILFTSSSPHHSNNTPIQFHILLSFDYIPKPSKLSRILIDHYHNLNYPYDGFIPKDDLLTNSYDYDWTFDSISTNYNSLFTSLSSSGYHIEELNSPLFTCDLREYSLLIIIDAEKQYSQEELTHLQSHFEEANLSILLISEWNNAIILNKFKDNTITSYGSDIKSLNSFLINYSIALGTDSISKEFYLNNHKIKLKSGTSIALFPSSGVLFGGYVNNDVYLVDHLHQQKHLMRAVLGLYENQQKESYGRIGLFTDSYCMDDYQMGFDSKEDNCLWMINNVVRYLIHGNYAYNEIDLQAKRMLIENYYNGEVIDGVDIDKALKGRSVNDFIPNILDVDYKKEMGLPGSSTRSFWDIVESTLGVFVPIIVIVVIGYVMIQIKAMNNKRSRMYAIQHLGEMAPITTIDDTRSISSERTVNSEMDLIA